MIPASYIQEWSIKAPWPDSRQVEQDMIISRALCGLSDSSALAGKIAFRGGTVINKLLFRQPLRYSEDIDLVQIQPEPIGATFDAIRDALSWLGCVRRGCRICFDSVQVRLDASAYHLRIMRMARKPRIHVPGGFHHKMPRQWRAGGLFHPRDRGEA